MATTTNYSWTTPDDTDLVKDGAAAIRTLGSSADTTVKNLNPGTTAGDIDYYTSGTAKARIAIGTAGQVLQVNSGATAPEWATPAGGGFTTLASGTLSGSSVVLSTINQSYQDLRLILQGVTINTGDTYITLKINSINTGYNACWALSYQDGGYVGGNSNETVFRIAQDAAQSRTNDNNMYVFNFFDYTSANDTKLGSAHFHLYSGDLRVYTSSLSVIGVDAAITEITISNNAGNTFSAGSYELIGIK